MASNAKPDDFPIVDPHHHFWDLGRNYYPWLCDPKPIPFRYGDYSSLKRNYMPPDYRRDAGALNIVKTVHAEALWDPSDPAGEDALARAGRAGIRLPACLHRRRLLRARRHRARCWRRMRRAS